MKKWLMLPVLALLTACVSYYTPEAGLEDGVYYPGDDPAYRYNSDDYNNFNVVFYPWASLDYFYLGYWPYPSYGFSFVYPYQFGFAAWGYPYSYYGYYAYYSPWYSPWQATYYYDPYWRPWRRNCHYHDRCFKDDNDDRDGRYAGGGQKYGYPGGHGGENPFYSSDIRSKMGRSGYPTNARYLAQAPVWRTGFQGVTTQSREPVKTGKSRSYTPNSRSYGASQGTRGTSSSGAFSGSARRTPSLSAPSRTRTPVHGRTSRVRDQN